MSVFDKAKINAEKLATDATEMAKNAGAKVSDLAGDAISAAKAKTAELSEDIGDAAEKAKDFVTEAASDVAEKAKEIGSAALDKVENWTGKDLNKDGKIGTSSK
jgi:hypothetical protein